MTDREKVKNIAKPSIKGAYCLGFRFTEEEEELIGFHIKRAKVFMMRYGRGRKPCSIDKEYYTYKGPKNNEVANNRLGNDCTGR